jgi:glycosyltransferase involved in cell wall biosynthesis
MRRVLFVLPSLAYSGAATQIGLLAGYLPRAEFEPRVCVLGGEGPMAGPLRAAGIGVDVLGWTRPVDFRWLLRLRALVRSFDPDMIHVHGLAALRAVILTGASRARLFVTAPSVGRSGGARLSSIDRWLLGRADGILAAGPADAERCRRLGLPGQRLAVVPLAVARRAAGDLPPQVATLVPPQDRVIVSVGPIEAHKGFRDALWAMGILGFVPADPHLLLIGTGPDRSRLETFAHITEVARRVHFVGEQPDIEPFLRRADMIWVPSRSPAGCTVALEAMAAGRPVIATDLPDLAAIVADGDTGFLVAPGDKVGLARRTRILLEAPDLCRRMGEAGRLRALRQFPVENLLTAWQSLCEETLASQPARATARSA